MCRVSTRSARKRFLSAVFLSAIAGALKPGVPHDHVADASALAVSGKIRHAVTRLLSLVDSISQESFMPGVLIAVRRVGLLDGLVIGLEHVL